MSIPKGTKREDISNYVTQKLNESLLSLTGVSMKYQDRTDADAAKLAALEEFVNAIEIAYEAKLAENRGPDRRFFHDIGHPAEAIRELHNPKSHLPLHNLLICQKTEKFRDERHLKDLMTTAFAGHDVVYYQYDKGIASLVTPVLSPYVSHSKESGQIFGRPALIDTFTPNQEAIERDNIASLVYDIFGDREASNGQATYKASQAKLGADGNELLSALYTAKMMERMGASAQDIAVVAAMIAATVPFKAQADFEKLHDRLMIANQVHNLGFSDDELHDAMQGAAYVANIDVGNFSAPEIRHVAQGTVALIPENAEVMRLGCPKPYPYAKSLLGSIAFLSGMANEENGMSYRNIYHGYGEYMADEMKAHYDHVTKNNLEANILELQAKYAGAMLVAALDCITESGAESYTLRDFVKDVKYPVNGSPFPEGSTHHQIYSFLKDGRGFEDVGEFDIDQSPVAALLFAATGDRIASLCDDIKKYERSDFTDKDDARAFVQMVAEKIGSDGRQVVEEIIDAVAAAQAAAFRQQSAHDLRDTKTLIFDTPSYHPTNVESVRQAHTQDSQISV